MGNPTLDLTILSANDLTKLGFFSNSKIQSYVSVSLLDSTSSSYNQRHTTPVDKTGNKNPNWNFPLKFTLNNSALQANRITLHLQVFSRRTILSDTLIGEVHVPVFGLFSSGVTPVSYPIRRKTSGKPKGVVNFWYKFADKNIPVAVPPAARVEPSVGYPYPYPPPAGPPAGTGYSYPLPLPPQAQVYGYGAQQQVVTPAYGGSSSSGMGLLGGALAGFVAGELVSDIADMAHDDYDGNDDAGYDDGGGYYDDGGGFDDGGGYYDDGGGYYDDGGFDF